MVSVTISIFDGPVETLAGGDADGVAADFDAAGGGDAGGVAADFDAAGGAATGATAGGRDAGATAGVSCNVGVVVFGVECAIGAESAGVAAAEGAAGTGGGTSSACIDGLLSSCGNALRLLIIQKAPASSRITPTTAAIGKTDLGSLRCGGS